MPPRSPIDRDQDRQRMTSVIGPYLVTQRDRCVLDEDIVAVLTDLADAVRAQVPAPQPLAA